MGVRSVKDLKSAPEGGGLFHFSWRLTKLLSYDLNFLEKSGEKISHVSSTVGRSDNGDNTDWFLYLSLS